MPRRVNLAMLLGLITVSVLSFGLTAGAQEEGGVTDEVTQAQETLAQMRIDQEMAAEEYNAAASTLQGLNGDITRTTQDLEAAEERLAEAEAKLSNRAGEIYKQGNVGFADLLLDSESASDFASRLDLVARLLITEREEVAELRAVKDELEDEAERRRQQIQNYEQTTSEMEARWERASALETEMEDYLASLNEAVLAEIEAEREARAQAAAEEAASLLAAQEMEAQQIAEEAQRAAEEEAARQAAAAEEALRALEAAATEQERQQAQAAAEEAQAAAEEAARQAAEEAIRAAAAADEQAKKQASQAAVDEQAALRAEQMNAQQAAEEDAAKYAIAAEEARKILEAAETEQERQQAQAEAQQAEAAAREQARKAAEAEQAKQDAEKALAEERQKSQPAGTQPTTPTLGAAPEGQDQPKAAQEGQDQPKAAQEGQDQPKAAPAPSGAGGAPVAEARSVQGDPYVWGGEAPGGFDCSGLVKWSYRGIMDLPHSVDGIGSMGTRISVSEAGPGDVLVWPGYHVAMVTGPGMMIHASDYHMQVIEVPQGDMQPASYAVRLA